MSLVASGSYGGKGIWKKTVKTSLCFLAKGKSGPTLHIIFTYNIGTRLYIPNNGIFVKLDTDKI